MDPLATYSGNYKYVHLSCCNLLLKGKSIKFVQHLLLEGNQAAWILFLLWLVNTFRLLQSSWKYVDCRSYCFYCCYYLSLHNRFNLGAGGCTYILVSMSFVIFVICYYCYLLFLLFVILVVVIAKLAQ